MRVQLVCSLVLALALAASARHIPRSHHALTKHQSYLRAVRHYLGKDLEEANDFVMANDAGSSGTKMMVYAKQGVSCPTLSGDVCDGKSVKVKPGLSAITGGTSVAEYFAGWQHIAAAFGGASNFEGYIAKATAGNRIISTSTNTSTWEALLHGSTGLQQVTGFGPAGTSKFGAPATMPGTMEAWMEYKAAVKLEGNPNFFSLGGASAQASFDLDSQAIATDFADIFSAVSMTGLPCNNQPSLTDYACVVKGALDVYTCMSWSAVKTECSSGCVGLISFLAGDGTQSGIAGCPITLSGGGHHRTGGTDQVKSNFKRWIQTSDGNQYATACDQGSDIATCLAGVEAFIDGDLLLTATASFVAKYTQATARTWLAAGNMKASLYFMRTPATHQGRIKPGDAPNGFAHTAMAFFYANGQALVNKAGVSASMVSPTNKIDWLDSAAEILGYTTKCDLPSHSSYAMADRECGYSVS
jgi:hypothetical protein